MTVGWDYYQSLLTQGYSADQALFYTQQYYPDFSLSPHTPPPAIVSQVHQQQFIQSTQPNHVTGQGVIITYSAPKNTLQSSKKFWIGAGVAILAIVVSIVLLIATLFSHVEDLLILEETPEFGFRHDVDSSVYCYLGANRNPYFGENHPDFSSTVNIYGADSSGEYWAGSGVIIAPYWVLTAAHVVEYLVASETSIFVGIDFGMNHYDDVVSVEEIYIHPGWEGDSELMESGLDIALIELTRPIDTNFSSIANWNNATTANLFTLDSTVYTAGYGSYDRDYSDCSDFCLDDGDGEYSQRRAWMNVVDRIITDIEPKHDYSGSQTLRGGFIVYDFDSPSGEHNSLDKSVMFTAQQGDYSYAGSGNSGANALPLEGTSVQGDSGGPTYALLNGTWTVVGLTAHGSATANYGDVAFNTNVASHSQWICSHDIENRPIFGCNSE